MYKRNFTLVFCISLIFIRLAQTTRHIRKIRSPRHWSCEEHFMRDLPTLACSLAPPFQIPTKLSPLQHSVLTGKPFAMELLLASPTRCELHAVIHFLSANGTFPLTFIISYVKSMGHSVWMSKTCESGSESSCTDVQMSMTNSILVSLRFRLKQLQKWSKNKKCLKIGMWQSRAVRTDPWSQ